MRCQALTHGGKQCSRDATVKIDLRKARNVFGYELPRVNCCFYCTQHATILTGIAVTKLAQYLAEYQYGWDEYLVLHPEYITEKGKDLLATPE